MINYINFYTKTYNLLVINMKNYLKSSLYTLGIMIISTIIITILNYFNIINGTLLKIIHYIIPIISIMIGSFMLGKTSSKKGYIEGLKYSGIWSIIFLIINIFTKELNLSSIIFFIILILLSMLSSILGINRKRI